MTYITKFYAWHIWPHFIYETYNQILYMTYITKFYIWHIWPNFIYNIQTKFYIWHIWPNFDVWWKKNASREIWSSSTIWRSCGGFGSLAMREIFFIEIFFFFFHRWQIWNTEPIYELERWQKAINFFSFQTGKTTVIKCTLVQVSEIL